MQNHNDWNLLATRVLEGHSLTRDEAQAILHAPDEETLELLSAAYRIRRRHFGNDVQLYLLRNAKSGLCPEDCGYCSQSAVSEADIPKYRFDSVDTLLTKAREAREAKARTFCIVASGRGPSDREVAHVAEAARKIKDELGMHLCACLGLLTPAQADVLAEAGIDRINHNLNTSSKYYEEICSTHTYQDRLETLQAARNAGMELCSGLIVGMGETNDDVVDVVMELKTLSVASLPVNFLHPVEGTPLEDRRVLDPRYCLRVLCLLRFAHPTTEIRVAGGREVNLRTLQPLALYAANSMFVSDYLTTKGQLPEEDYRMIEDLGFVVSIAAPHEHEDVCH